MPHGVLCAQALCCVLYALNYSARQQNCDTMWVVLCRAVPCCADRFAADQLDLKPEPSLESFGIKTDKAAQQQGQQQPGKQQQQGNGAADSEDEPGTICY